MTGILFRRTKGYIELASPLTLKKNYLLRLNFNLILIDLSFMR